MYKVTKEIHFCYGHRLLRYQGKCRFLHGHNAKVEVELSSASLDHRGMVMDFDEVKRGLQQWIDETLDHKMLLNEADPLTALLRGQKEPLVTLKENPTAETLAQMIFEYARDRNYPVTQVRFWETPTSFATYQGDARTASGPPPRQPARHRGR